METEIKVSTKNLENAKNIKLSKNTHTLIMCRAMLSDIQETVVEVVGELYGNRQDEYLEDFRDRQCNLDIELCSLISTFIEVTTLDGDTKTGSFKEM